MALEADDIVANTFRQSDRQTPGAFLLGDVEVHPESLLVIVGGESRRVEPKVMDLLVYGSNRAGQLLSKQQIMEDLWGGTHPVPEALQRVVSLLRKALGDRPAAPVFVETVSKIGYRFLLAPDQITGGESIKLTEKNVRVTPLVLVIGALILVLLTWFAVNEFGREEAVAPRADGSLEDQSTEPAPAPEAD